MVRVLLVCRPYSFLFITLCSINPSVCMLGLFYICGAVQQVECRPVARTFDFRDTDLFGVA